MSFKEDCVFCKIIKGEIPCEKVFENDQVLGFKDIHPVAPIHYLFIPKTHIDSLAEMKPNDAKLIENIYAGALEVIQQAGFKKAGFRTVINTNKNGGQDVFHIHLHLIAGKQLGKMTT